MELILVPGDVSRLQSRNTAFRRNLKYSAIEHRLFLVKISEFNSEASVPSRRRAEQAAEIDIKFFHLTAHPAFGQGHELVNRINGNVDAANANIGVERSLRLVQQDRAGNISGGYGVIEIDRQLSSRNLRRVDINRTKSLIVRQHDLAHDQVPIRVGRGCRQFQPGLAADELQLLDCDFAGMMRVQIDRDVFGDKIVRTIADNDRGGGNVKALRKNITQVDLLFRIRRAGSQRRLLRIHDNARGMNIGVRDRARESVPQQREQAVIDSGKIDID